MSTKLQNMKWAAHNCVAMRFKRFVNRTEAVENHVKRRQGKILVSKILLKYFF